ncbi:MAG TPA: hypothetical protein PLK81_05450, partial [Kiritimatiellia bacterium]|nr:hypothetical protein [Kiritimatiellia bacterium]
MENPARFFHAMETFFPDFPRYGKYFSTPWKTSPVRCPQACHAMGVNVAAEAFVGILPGSLAKITGGFFDDAALRPVRTGLVSVRDRPRSGSAEKTAVGFCAGKIQTKASSLPAPRTSLIPAPLTAPAARVPAYRQTARR